VKKALARQGDAGGRGLIGAVALAGAELLGLDTTQACCLPPAGVLCTGGSGGISKEFCGRMVTMKLNDNLLRSQSERAANWESEQHFPAATPLLPCTWMILRCLEVNIN